MDEGVIYDHGVTPLYLGSGEAGRVREKGSTGERHGTVAEVLIRRGRPESFNGILNRVTGPGCIRTGLAT